MSRRIDVGCLMDEDKEHLLSCASDVGSFVGQCMVSLFVKAVAPTAKSEAFHPDKQFPISWVKNHLGVSAQTVRNRIRDGSLRAIRTDTGKYYFRWEDIKQYQENQNGKSKSR